MSSNITYRLDNQFEFCWVKEERHRLPRPSRLINDSIIAKRIVAGDRRAYHYALYRAGMVGKAPFVEPARVYGERWVNVAQYFSRKEITSFTRYAGPLSLLPDTYWPVYMRGLRWIRVARYPSVRSYCTDILKRYFRAKKFTCVTLDGYWAEVRRLDETCRREIWLRGVDPAAEYLSPTDGWGWIGGEYVKLAERPEFVLLGAKLESAEKEAAAAQAKIDRLESECDALRRQVDALLSGKTAEAANALLSQPGQYRDSQVPQLYLRVDRDGTRSWWVNVAKMRKYVGKPASRAAFKKVGAFGVLTLADARVEALRRLAGGKYTRTTTASPSIKYVAGDNAMEARAIAQALYEMGIIKPGELQ